MKIFSWIILGISALMGGMFGTPGESPTGAEGVRVVAFWSIECPVAERYSLRLRALQYEFGARGVSFEAVFPQEGETEAEIESTLRKRGIFMRWRRDPKGDLAEKYNVRRIPTVIVFDPKGDIVYHGAIDDAPREGIVTKPFLRNALNAALEGTLPGITVTEPTGCLVMPEVDEVILPMTTYHEDIKPKLERMCVSCHSAGGPAPLRLDNYLDARRWAPMIQDVLERGKMPPVRPSVTDEVELAAAVARWRESGRPAGTEPSGQADNGFGSPRDRVEIPTTVPLPSRDRSLQVIRKFTAATELEPGALTLRTQRPHELRGVDMIVHRDGSDWLVGRWRGGIVGTFSGIRKGERVVVKLLYAASAIPGWDRPVLEILTSGDVTPAVLLESVPPTQLALRQQHLATQIRAEFEIVTDADVSWVRPRFPISLSDLSVYQVINGKEIAITFGDRLAVDWPRIFAPSSPLTGGGRFVVVGYSKKRLEQLEPILQKTDVSLDLGVRPH